MRSGKATRSWLFQRWGDTGRKCEDPGQPRDVVSVSRWTWERVPRASHPLLGHLGIPMRHFVTSFPPRWQQTTSSSPCEPPCYSQAHARRQFVFSSCVCVKCGVGIRYVFAYVHAWVSAYVCVHTCMWRAKVAFTDLPLPRSTLILWDRVSTEPGSSIRQV